MLKLVVLSCLMAAAAASALLPYSYPLYYGAYPYNYRGPLSLAPGQPANILGADGRPLDTLDVNLDRAAHYTAKAFAPHLLKKRSVAAVVAPVAPVAPVATYPLAYTTAYSAPLAYRTPLAYPSYSYALGHNYGYSAPLIY